MTWRIPSFMTLLCPPRLGNGHQTLFVYTRISRLVECVDTNIETRIFSEIQTWLVSTYFHLLISTKVPDYFVSVLVCVEAVHQNQRNIGIIFLVEILNLLNCQVKEGQVWSHWYHRFRSTAAHRGPQTSIELDDHQLVQHLLDGGLGLRCVQVTIGQDLTINY